jgi:hypothetical protein
LSRRGGGGNGNDGRVGAGVVLSLAQFCSDGHIVLCDLNETRGKRRVVLLNVLEGLVVPLKDASLVLSAEMSRQSGVDRLFWQTVQGLSEETNIFLTVLGKVGERKASDLESGEQE